MPGRLPEQADLPAGTVGTIIPPPSSDPATNILLLLHGIGDTHAPFATLGSRLQLPETACLALRGPSPLPFDLGGFHWADDILFDQGGEGIDADAGFSKATDLILDKVIRQVLIAKCGYATRDIVIYGFGQGGMAALSVAARLAAEKDGAPESLGGVMSVGGPLPTSTRILPAEKAPTPVLLCKGRSRSAVKDGDEERLKEAFEHVQIVEWKRSGDAMPTNREEMMPIMQFFARRLRSSKGVPAGSVEIT